MMVMVVKAKHKSVVKTFYLELRKQRVLARVFTLGATN